MQGPLVTMTRGAKGVIVKKPDGRHTETEPFAESHAGEWELKLQPWLLTIAVQLPPWPLADCR